VVGRRGVGMDVHALVRGFELLWAGTRFKGGTIIFFLGKNLK